jgi:hypothetical protein
LEAAVMRKARGHETNARSSLFTPTLLKVSAQQLKTPLALSVIQEAAAISVSQMKPI